MALTAGSVFAVQSTAATGNTGGAGFNPNNANFLTNLTTDSNTANTNSPVVSSASYNFVAGDVGAWVYIKSGTNWTPGWYQIASVASNKATLSAAVGQAVQISTTTGAYGANTVAGVATVGTPTNGTFGVDYSQQDTAKTTATDFAATGASTTLTSATAAFTPVMVGNFFHQTTTGTGAFGLVGWYEIVSYTNATTVVLDRTPNSGTASVATTGFVGGAGRLNGLEDEFYEMLPAGSYVWIKSGTYILSAAISVSTSTSTTTDPIKSMGFVSLRGDSCTGDNRPLIAAGANTNLYLGAFQFYNLIYTSSAASGITPGANSMAINCKFINSSSTASRVAITCGSLGAYINCEAISQNGTAFSSGSAASKFSGCYAHDSAIGYSTSTAGQTLIDCVAEACATTGILSAATATSTHVLWGNTVYGREAKMGVGVDFGAGVLSNLWNNVFYGLTTAVSFSAKKGTNVGSANNFFNNTTDATNFDIGPGNYALDPQFVGATQLTGTTATTSGSVLTDSGANFSTVTDNVDYVRVISGTGVTVANYLITSHTTTTLTVNNALGTSVAGNVVYFVTTGHNFTPGVNMKNLAYPLSYGEATNYRYLGAISPQASGGGSYTFS